MSSFSGAAIAGIFFFIICCVDGIYLNKRYDTLIIIAFLLYFLFLLEFISVKDQTIKNISKIKVIYPAVLFVVFTSLSWNLVKKIFFFKKYVKSSSQSDLSIESIQPEVFDTIYFWLLKFRLTISLEEYEALIDQTWKNFFPKHHVLVKYNPNILKEEIRNSLDRYHEFQSASEINNYIKERKIQLISDASSLKVFESNSTLVLEKSVSFYDKISNFLKGILSVPLESTNWIYIIGGSVVIISGLRLYNSNISLSGCGQYVSKWVYDIGMFYIFGILPGDDGTTDLITKQLDIESKSNTSNVESTPQIESNDNHFKLSDRLDQMIFELKIDKIIKEQVAFDKVVENTIGKKP